MSSLIKSKNQPVIYNAVREYVKIALFGAMALMLLFFPSETSNAALQASMTFFKSVFPTLFPFSVIATEITNGIRIKNGNDDGIMQRLLGVPKITLLPFVLGTISGYPMGAKLICELHEKKLLSSEQAQRASYFCVNCGPIYLITTVGLGFLGNIRAGITAYICHLIPPITFAAISWLFCKASKSSVSCKSDSAQTVDYTPKPRQGSVFLQCVLSCLNICGGMMFFAVVAACMRILPLPQALKTFFELTLEISGGCKLASTFEHKIATAVISALAAFGDICILLQCKPYLDACNVRFSKFVSIKALCGLAAFLLCYTLCGILQ